jgi:hypothetical protein
MIISETRHDTALNWINLNPVLAKNETGFEDDTGKFKVGNGVAHWTALDYSIPSPPGPPISGVSEEALNDHINSPLPHPIYDNGPSLILLYQNAKV